MMDDTNHNQIAVNILRPKQLTAFSIFSRTWFIEGLLYSTFIALIWTNEEPSKLNTLLAAWSAYGIVAFAMLQGIKARTITNPSKWIRIYFIQSLFLLLVCDFVWLRGTIARTSGSFFDPVRFDYIAARLAYSGLDPRAVALTNHTGTIWYAGFIYWIFGISKFYVVLFNGSFAFVTWILFASTMTEIEGNPRRWQWLRFGALLPDFILYFANITKGPLSAFIIALGIWLIARSTRQKKFFNKSIMLLIPVLMLGLTIRTATSLIVLIVTFIWLWQYSGRQRKTKLIVLFVVILVSGQLVTSSLMKFTGGMDFNYISNLSVLVDPDQRHRVSLDYQASSWNAITESLPAYLMPVGVFIKGLFMMIAPLPINFHLALVFEDVIFSANYGSIVVQQFFQKTNALLFLLSFPLLMTSLFDVYRSNRRLWLMFSITFVILIGFMGFSVFGMIEPRYRAMLLPFWLVVCGIGYYYGKPKRYIMPTAGILAFGALVYLIPKI